MDDEEAIRMLCARILERNGFSVAAADEGNETLRLYQEAHDAGQPFQLVILDLTIPGGMGGEETLKELRKINPSVRAIVSSGYSNSDILEQPAFRGICGLITKPYDRNDLLVAVQEALDQGPG